MSEIKELPFYVKKYVKKLPPCTCGCLYHYGSRTLGMFPPAVTIECDACRKSRIETFATILNIIKEK